MGGKPTQVKVREADEYVTDEPPFNGDGVVVG
jgi:hypothetical protein